MPLMLQIYVSVDLLLVLYLLFVGVQLSINLKHKLLLLEALLKQNSLLLIQLGNLLVTCEWSWRIWDLSRNNLLWSILITNQLSRWLIIILLLLNGLATVIFDSSSYKIGDKKRISYVNISEVFWTHLMILLNLLVTFFIQDIAVVWWAITKVMIPNFVGIWADFYYFCNSAHCHGPCCNFSLLYDVMSCVIFWTCYLEYFSNNMLFHLNGSCHILDLLPWVFLQ